MQFGFNLSLIVIVAFFLFIWCTLCIGNVRAGVTNYAAWTVLDVNGERPAATCDHSVLAISDHEFLTVFGEEDASRYWSTDGLWVFDLHTNEWTSYNDTFLPMPRVSASAVYSETRNIAYFFMGYADVPTFQSEELWELDLDTMQWSSVYLEHGDGFPDARAWMDIALLNENDVLLFSGLAEKDYMMDEWVYNLNSGTWTELSNDVCTLNGTICPDYLTPFLDYLNSTCIHNAPIPPVEDYELLFNSTINTFLNMTWNDIWAGNSFGCYEGCTNSTFVLEGNDPGVAPVPREGHRITNTGEGELIMTGGYFCAIDGVWLTGGEFCYDSSVWIMNTTTLKWTEIPKPAEGELGAENWPVRPFAYHVQEYHNGKLWIWGGSYFDQASLNYYSDVTYVFDVATRTYESVIILGSPPTAVWSSGSALFYEETSTGIQANMHVFGGCAGAYFDNDVHVLKLDVQLDENNVGLFDSSSVDEGVVAGQSLDVRIQMESDDGILTWAVGLGSDFSVSLVESISGQTIVSTLLSTDVGGGVYSINATLSYGPEASLYVFFQGEPIPNSPFLIPVSAGAVESEQFTVNEVTGGAGLQGEVYTLYVEPRDSFGNLAMVNSSDVGMLSVTLVDGDLQDVEVSIVNNTYMVEYIVPYTDSYELIIEYDGVEIADSPMEFTALTGPPAPKLEVVNFDSGAQVAVMVIAGLMCLVIISISIFTFQKRENIFFVKASWRLILLILFGCALLAVSVIVLAMPNSPAVCEAKDWLPNIALYLTVSPIAGKMYRLYRIFNSGGAAMKVRKFSDKWLISTQLPLFCVMILCLILRSALVPYDLFSDDEPKCNVKSNLRTSHVVLTVLITLCHATVIGGATAFSYMTKNVPAAYNESGLYSLAMYNTVTMCVIVLLAKLVMPMDDVAATTTQVICLLFGLVIIIYAIFSGPFSKFRHAAKVNPSANIPKSQINRTTTPSRAVSRVSSVSTRVEGVDVSTSDRNLESYSEAEDQSAAVYAQLATLERKKKELEEQMAEKLADIANIMFDVQDPHDKYKTSFRKAASKVAKRSGTGGLTINIAKSDWKQSPMNSVNKRTPNQSPRNNPQEATNNEDTKIAVDTLQAP